MKSTEKGRTALGFISWSAATVAARDRSTWRKEGVQSYNHLGFRLERTDFDSALCEGFKLLIDRFSNFFSRKSVEKMFHQKKTLGHRTSKIVKSGKAIAMAICPVIVHFITLSAFS